MDYYISEYYLYIKWLHVVGVICWMAGIFYLPRLFVYHARFAFNSEEDKLFQMMEARLLKIIMQPAMIISLISGGLLISYWGFAGNIWLHAKLSLVLVMLVIHFRLMRHRIMFMQGKNQHSHAYFRLLNEAPPILMMVITFFVIVKPF